MHYSRPRLHCFAPAALFLTLVLGLVSCPAHAARHASHAFRRSAKHTPKPQTAPALPGWTLTFDDEFDAPALDTTKWTATDWPSDINGEQEDYAPDDVSLHDGILRLESRKRQRAGREYTSGEVRSVGKFSQLYGRFEFRARLAKTQSTWTAEYLIAENDHWPPEIDVEEYLGRDPDTLHMTAHWANRGGAHGSFHVGHQDPAADYTKWHVYAVEWEPGMVRWFIDGKLCATSGDDAKPFISHVPMYLRINTAVGGWGGGPDAGTVWPQFHDVDYVRVYRRNAMPPPVNAGPDQELAYPVRTAHLAGISCNPMGPHTALWSQVAGPGRTAFSQPRRLDTSAVFSAPGTYHLRLSISDGPVSAYDDMTVLVDSAQAVSVPAQADAYAFVNSARPDIHADGAAPILEVGVRPSHDDTHDQMQSFLTFNLSHVPRASHAFLRLYGGQIYTSYPKSLPCLVDAVAAPDWDEKQSTWADMPALGPQAAAFVVRPLVHNSTERWYDIDVTAAVQAAQAANQTQAGFALLPATPGGRISASFHSREEAAHAPHLIITP